MGLFLSAADAWTSLLTISYRLRIGRKGKMRELLLQFRPVDFDHLSGMHYATDIDFKRHRKEYQGEKLLGALHTGLLDDTLIEKSMNWPKIANRLAAIVHLREILESDFEVYTFDPKRLPFYSNIQASYLLFNPEIDEGVFLFFDRDNDVYYCKSLFHDDVCDYRVGQSKWTVLTKSRYTDSKETLLYRHPHYKEIQGQILS